MNAGTHQNFKNVIEKTGVVNMQNWEMRKNQPTNQKLKINPDRPTIEDITVLALCPSCGGVILENGDCKCS